jgi:hypothetical protein
VKQRERLSVASINEPARTRIDQLSIVVRTNSLIVD